MNRVLHNKRDVSVQFATAVLTVPPGFRNIIHLIGHQVLKVQPSAGETIDFIAKYVQNLLSVREATGYDPAIHGDMLERIQAHYHQMYGSELQMVTQAEPQTTTNDATEDDDEIEYMEEAAALGAGVAASSEDLGDAMADDAVEEHSNAAQVNETEMAADTATEHSDTQPEGVGDDIADDAMEKPSNATPVNKDEMAADTATEHPTDTQPEDVVEDNPTEELGDTEAVDASVEHSSNTAEDVNPEVAK
ncbi:sperm surface protein Sp17-like isoform X1 [Anneissia japonica]|uniref:sperm surface protein Sp17-like isoform X1 n=1 Tax=Anneissia japonica TaxID=1529436 RepID=UPI0014255AC6|nr:sperm surface protein Sp17-like isoform X1 [Anneissia japonica]XP_033117267.1 sperm surface protein Sp17-like isoform X1 [Anneissia japonica]